MTEKVSEERLRLIGECGGAAWGEESLSMANELITLRAVNAELVSALEAMVSDVNRSDYHTRRRVFEQARAALVKAKEKGQPEG